MKYQCSIIIDLPLNEVIQKLDNPDHLKHWMPNLIRYEIVQGKPGEEGSKMKLFFKQGKKQMETTETIITNNLPDELVSTYEMKNVWNKQDNLFEKMEENKTLWTSHNVFKFSGLWMNLLFFFLGTNSFRKETMKFMRNFKLFAEQGVSLISPKNK